MDKPKAIYNTAKVGDIVVLDKVGFIDNHPLAQFAQPAFFVVTVFRPESQSARYTAHASDGERVNISSDDAWWFFQVRDWWTWTKATHDESIRDHKVLATRLTTERDVLKSVLVAQGVRIVTKEQAEALGVKDK